MASFSSLRFSVSIFRLCGIVVPTGSCQTAGITALGISGLSTGNFLRSLFISLFEPIVMSVLLTKLLLLCSFFYPMFKLKLLGSIYMPVPTENLPLIKHALTLLDTFQYRYQ